MIPLFNSFAVSVKMLPGLGKGGEEGERRKKSVQTQHSLRCVFGSHRITVEPIRALILHDQNTCACPLLVSFSTLRIL